MYAVFDAKTALLTTRLQIEQEESDPLHSIDKAIVSLPTQSSALYAITAYDNYMHTQNISVQYKNSLISIN